MFIALLSSIVKDEKQSKCSVTIKWIDFAVFVQWNTNVESESKDYILFESIYIKLKMCKANIWLQKSNIVVLFGKNIMTGRAYEKGFWTLTNLIWMMVNKCVHKQALLNYIHIIYRSYVYI